MQFVGFYSNPAANYAKHLYINGVEITDLVIPETVTEINDLAFAVCYCISSISIPKSVKKIGNCAFLECSGLQKAEFASIEHLCQIEFGGVYSNPLNYASLLYINDTPITEVKIPDSVTKIGNYAFEGYRAMTAVDIPNSVTEIGKYAFSKCQGLKSVTLPSSVTKICSMAFNYCCFSSLTLPDSPVTYCDSAFLQCYNIKGIYYNTENPVKGDASIFGRRILNHQNSDTYLFATLYLPTKAIEKARHIDPWRNFKTIKPYDFNDVSDIDSDGDSDSNIDYALPYEIYNMDGQTWAIARKMLHREFTLSVKAKK